MNLVAFPAPAYHLYMRELFLQVKAGARKDWKANVIMHDSASAFSKSGHAFWVGYMQ
jgi:hypothetical protein